MSSIALSGNASGAGVFTIASPNSASSYTATLPAATTTLVGTDATQTLTNKTLTSPTITGASMSSMASSVITSGTSVASTSGTSIDFTGIPSWVKRITVMLKGVSTSGTSALLFQLGTSGGVQTTGYTANSGANTYTTGFGAAVLSIASDAGTGVVTFTLLDSATGTWSWGGTIGRDTTFTVMGCIGYKALSGTLDRIRLTTVNGTDTFDAGSINILYE